MALIEVEGQNNQHLGGEVNIRECLATFRRSGQKEAWLRTKWNTDTAVDMNRGPGSRTR